MNFSVVIHTNAKILVMKQKRGISYSRSNSKRRKQGADVVGVSSSLNMGGDACGQSNNEDSSELIKFHKKQKTTGMQLCTRTSIANNCLENACKPKLDTPG